MRDEVNFYIQQNINNTWGNTWENILLYKKGNVPVGIWACKDDMFRDDFDCFGMNITDDDIEEVAMVTGWKEDGHKWFHTCRAISLSKLMYLATKSNFFANLVNEIECYLKLAGRDYADTDNIRVIAFAN